MDDSSMRDDTIIDIVVMLAEIADSSGGVLADPRSARKKIIKKGHSPKQVDRALSLFGKKSNFRVKKPHRVFSEHELSFLSPESAKMLSSLVRYGILSDEQVELIFIRASLDEEKLNLDEFRRVAEMVIDIDNLKVSEAAFVEGDEDTVN
ncbi:MAG TPA: DUF494 family protein [candidate division Zixibacteria bacterium]|nr:DUF494 family protein [candidate division Zixibacteria bacterium]